MALRVAFAGNHRRTLIFKEVASRLEASGHEAFWIATGSYWMRNLLAPYGGRVLDISKIKNTEKDDLALLEQFSELPVNGIISADRVLRQKPYSEALAYVSAVFSGVRSFLTENSVDIVFGEATWAHELVTAAVCRLLCIPYLSPVNVRYPSGRFVFFNGIFQKEIVSFNNVIDMQAGQSLYDRFIEEGSRPFYMDRVRRGRVKPFVRHLKRHMAGDTADMTVPDICRLTADSGRKSFGGYKGAERPSGKYIYLPLQCAPEASVDVLSGFYADMAEFVRAAAMCVPVGYTLAVKEHPLQTRGWAFYRKISSLPSVQLIDKNADSMALIRGAEAVVSVSGTACYEAALYGVPSVTFAEMFFSELMLVKKCTGYEKLYSVLKDALLTETGADEAPAFLSKIYSLSYEGFCESPDVYPGALDSENVKKVTEAFTELLSGYSSSKSATADSMCSRFI